MRSLTIISTGFIAIRPQLQGAPCAPRKPPLRFASRHRRDSLAGHMLAGTARTRTFGRSDSMPFVSAFMHPARLRNDGDLNPLDLGLSTLDIHTHQFVGWTRAACPPWFWHYGFILLPVRYQLLTAFEDRIRIFCKTPSARHYQDLIHALYLKYSAGHF